MEFLIVWFFFTLATTWVAQSKGRSVAGWLFAGLLFGLFALITVAFLPSVSSEQT